MLKRHNELFKNLMLLNDLVLVTLAWWAAYLIRFHTLLFVPREDYVFRHYVVAWLLVLAVWTIVFAGLDIYRPRRISSRLREIADLLKASCLALPIFLAVLFLIREIVLSRAVVVIEASDKSGSLITAGCAAEQGRDVMAVPGSILSARNRGGHALLRDGAKIRVRGRYSGGAGFPAP